jgi:predicted outer membrane repeat protein
MFRLSRVAAGLLLAAGLVSAQAATFSVGEPGDGACTHGTVAAAVSAASTTPGGPHRIKLAFASRLLASNAVADLLSISNPVADIEIEGGYANCAAAEPVAFESVFGLQPGGVGRVLRIDHAGTTRSITLRRVRLVNGNTTSFPVGVDYGGAVRVAGNVELVLEDGSNVGANGAETAGGRGGGIYCQGRPSRVWLGASQVVGNYSLGNGGGIYLDDCSGLFALPNPAGGLASINLQNNSAGVIGDDARGFGGAIYSYASEIQIAAATATNHAAWFLNNGAQRGGAIYTASDGIGPVPVTLMNTALLDNVARNKGGALHATGMVDIVIGHDRDAPCSLDLFVAGAQRLLNGCSLIVGNRSDNGGATATSGGAVAYLTAAAGLVPTPRIEIQRSKLRHNRDAGLAALAYVQNAQLWLRNSIVLDNRANGDAALLPALLRLFSGGPHLLQHSTVLDNAVHRVARVQSSELRAAGSAVWQPAVGSDQRLLELGPGGSLTHRGCLLFSPFDSTVPFETIEEDIDTQGTSANSDGLRLEADYRPRLDSRAVDGCSSSRADAGLDFYGQARGFDVPGVVNFVWHAEIPGDYVNDFGAVELRSLELFKDGFESP